MKIRRMFLLTLTILVFLVSSQVNFAAGVITAERKTDSPVDHKAVKTLTYSQEEPVEIISKRNNKEVVLLMDSSASMDEFIDKTSSPFDYALFSGNKNSDMDMQGSSVKIKGNVHSNRDVIQRANEIELKGICEAVGEVRIDAGGKNFTSDTIIANGASHVGMPDLSDDFKSAAEVSDTRLSDKIVPGLGIKYYELALKPTGEFIDSGFDGSTHKDLRCYHHDPVSWQLTGTALKLQEGKPLFIEGNVIISVSRIEGNGFIVATGNIEFNTGNFLSNPIGIYSTKGDVKFNVGNVELTGVIYAPGDKDSDVGGTIYMHSSNLTVTGSVIAKNLSTKNQLVNITYSSTKAHEEVKRYEKGAKHIGIARDNANLFIDKLKFYNDFNTDLSIRMGLITYSDKAVKVGSGFYTINGESDDLKTEIGKIKVSEKIEAEDPSKLTQGGCNFGDGLRRAYYMLMNSSDTNAEKYIVVISCNDPNKWTQDGSGFKTDNGNEAVDDDIRGNGIDDPGGEALDYTKEIAGMINSGDKIKTYFVDIKSVEELTQINEIAQEAGADEVVSGKYFYNPEEDKTAGITLQGAVGDVLEVISDKITSEESCLEPTVTATFTDLLPEGVKIIEAGEFNTTIESGRYKLTLKPGVDIETETEGVVFKAKIPDLEIEIKYDEMIDVKDDLTEDKEFDEIFIEYTFCFPDGTSQIEYVEIEELTVVVEWKIDIT